MKKVISLICALILVISLASCSKKGGEDEPVFEQLSTETTTEGYTKGLPSGDVSEDWGSVYEKPVDLGLMQAENPDVYAYIHVPGTNISYPIVQSGVDDNFYLRRDWHKQSTYRGSIMTQSINNKDFLDAVTVIYGHNTDVGDMFSQLLYFRDADFFNKHDIFYIYLPHQILVYKIISAHSYDDRHIMNSYDFDNDEVLLDFQKSLLNPATIERNVRDGIYLDRESEIVVLSTCDKARSTATNRYLVNGVLIKNVATR